MNLTLPEIATIAAATTVVLSAGLTVIGSVAFMFLKDKFITPKKLKTFCESQQTVCQLKVCSDVKEVNSAVTQMRKEIRVMDKKREDARKEADEKEQARLTAQTKKDEELFKFMGNVERYMKDHNGVTG